MAHKFEVAGKRKTARINYSKFNSTGRTEMDGDNLLKLQAEEDGEFEFEQNESEEENQEEWEQRRTAVNDKNYKREQEHYQQ